MSKSENRKALTKRIIIGVIVALVLLYIVFLFITTNFLGNSNIETEIAYRSTVYDVVKTTGFVIRDEEIIKSNVGGVLVYEVGDGDKITTKGTIATVYSSEEDVVAMQQINSIEEKIEYLRSLNSVSTSVNVGIDIVNSQLNDKLVTLIGKVNSRNFDTISPIEDDLMSSIFRKQIITGEQSHFDDKIAELTAEKSELEASTGAPVGNVTSPSAGYFVTKVDGYEGSFDINELDDIKASDLENVEQKESEQSNYIGKVIKGVNWYIACPVSSDEATNINHNSDSIYIRLPYAVSGDIPAKLVTVNRLSSEEQAVVVLQCNYMTDALSKVRQEQVEIVVNKYEGLKISKKAIHDDEVTRTHTDDSGKKTTEKKRVQGVYVEYGNELVFRQVVIAYSSDDFVICKEDPEDDELFNGSTITLYDKVVVEGGDLFNGKLIQ